MSHSADRPDIPPLTSLRFFAAAVVVAFHYDPERFTRMPDFLQNWLETGYDAVTFFFVLSGFVLGYIYLGGEGERSRLNLRAFFAARFARLAPAYYFSLLVALPFFLAAYFFFDEADPRNFWLHGTLVVAWLQSWWPPAALEWNPPAWSVSVEWFLYLAFPLILWAARFVPSTTFAAAAYLLVVAVAIFRVVVMAPIGEEGPDGWNFAQFFPLFHLPQFILGVALGRLHLEGPRPPPALAGWMFAAGAVGLMIIFWDLEDLPARIRSNAVLGVFFGLLILGAAQPGHFAYRALSLRPLVFLGNISYSIYALHQPIGFYWEWYGPREFDIDLGSIPDFALYFAIVLGLSALSYLYVELPLRRRIRRWGKPQPRIEGAAQAEAPRP
ncbi:MAG TPA: acyltransferase [Alphaproteobacteria bacterium]|jgi:peptidoglycan/LPS O-acetylase OafA/YrhL